MAMARSGDRPQERSLLLRDGGRNSILPVTAMRRQQKKI